MLIIYLLLLILFSFLLIKSTEILIQALERLSQMSKIGKFALTSSLMALATSLPELFVGITAALEKQSSLALGNVLGSNIANISFVIGGAAIIGGSIGVAGNFLKKDIFYTFLAGGFPLILLFDGKLSRVEGLILLLVYGIYNYTVLLEKKRKKYTSGQLAKKIITRLNHKGTERQIAWVFLGALLLVFSADAIVKIAGLVAFSFKVPLFLIGLFLVAIGTSLPELSFEIGAIRKKQVGMVFGDLLGSITANSTLILGIVALINPVILESGFKPYLWATLAYFLIFGLFWLFIKTKRKLERWEGLVLFLVYILFIIFEFWRISQAPATVMYSGAGY
jgi:cation:H+ antiporter